MIPDNPTAKNWSAEKIKHYQWKPSDILFDYIGLIDTSLYNYQVENDETFAGLNDTISNINGRVTKLEIIDSELDTDSTHLVENKAVAKAIASLDARVKVVEGYDNGDNEEY